MDISNEMRKELNRRFAFGEQYLDYFVTVDDDGETHYEIGTTSARYLWEQRAVYNKILPIIERLQKSEFHFDHDWEELIYGKNGLVERLMPLQRAYNDVKNRKSEYLNRCAYGVLFVEDGSVDMDDLAEEGVEPGKVVVYRQGSAQPAVLGTDWKMYNIYKTECHEIYQEMLDIAKEYKESVLEK